MALLQIDDPMMASVPVGIDLGTTYSLIAYVAPTGDAIALRVCDDDPLMPSVVHYSDSGAVLVGSDAAAFSRSLPKQTLVSVKRFMGRSLKEMPAADASGYVFEAGSDLARFVVGGARVVTAVEASAEILRELKRRAEKKVGPVGAVVVTVPAYFDDAQRQATKDAGVLAGLNVVRLLNEPTAAALAYGLQSQKNGMFVVYDLGGGTFDVTVLSLDDGVFQVRAVGGDSHLGGDDMDHALATIIQKRCAPSIGVRALKDIAKHIKHGLTDASEVSANLETSLGTEAVNAAVTVTRAEFEEAIAPLLERTGIAVRRALKDADLTASQIDGVILVGGATRVPAVRACVRHIFGDKLLADIDPDQVVALGAAYQAEMLAKQRGSRDVLLLDVLPLSLGIEAMGGVVERILPRNTAIPAAAAQIFTTYADNQTGLVVHVVQGERELANDNRSLAKFTLKGIPPMAAGMARIEVRFAVDENGLLAVSAREMSTGVVADVKVEPSYGLSAEEMEQMLSDAYDHAESDVQARKLSEQCIEAERIVRATQKALAEDGSLLITGESEAIERAMHAVEVGAQGNDGEVIARAIVSLDAATKSFAGRRMDAHMKRALRGHALVELEQETAGAEGIEKHLGPTAS